ncbi:aldo/keto reductase [Acetobacteraceae bacterium H6797]|nr:aldo/keto reductase [Acetobacteraceae bacterium H6797]
MKYGKLGRSGLKVSPLCLGTMMFGGETPDAEAGEIIASARDAGINFIDTADMYNAGNSERVVGAAIRSDRDKWVLASKVCNPASDWPNHRGLSRKWVLQATEASLTRLGTDYLDILYLHKEDLDTPLEETVGALEALIRAGKVRYVGVSNFRSWRVAKLCHLAKEAGIEPPIVTQPYYNLFNRMPEVEQIPMAAHYGLGVVPYSPLARGVLTAKYRPGAKPDAQSRAGRADKRMMTTEWREESLILASTIADYAASRGTTAAVLAINWVLANKAVSSVIGGPRTMAHWQGYLEALNYGFTAQDEAFLSGLVVPGHASTPGYNDPAYPIEGRMV